MRDCGHHISGHLLRLYVQHCCLTGSCLWDAHTASWRLSDSGFHRAQHDSVLRKLSSVFFAFGFGSRGPLVRKQR